MPVFLPCAGTRAQIDARPVADGQFLVATDTGEAFVDIGGRRIRISGSSGQSGGTGGDDDDDPNLFTFWPIAHASLRMSDSVSGGGPGAGVTNMPAVILPEIADDLSLAFAVASAALLVSGSVSGGGPGDGVTGTPAADIPAIGDDLDTSYSITEAS
jgi:hypothetical protein